MVADLCSGASVVDDWPTNLASTPPKNVVVPLAPCFRVTHSISFRLDTCSSQRSQDECRPNNSEGVGFKLLRCHDLSSAPSLYGIHKCHDTGNVALFPLVGLWPNCVMLLLYGWTSGSYFPLFATYVFGTVISTAYIGVYFRWTKARAYAAKAIGAAFISNVLGSVYVVLGMTGFTGQPTSQVELVSGNMMTIDCLLPYVAPFETIKTVLETRYGASIPFGMCLAGATSNLIWTIEGLFTDDMFILFPSAACSTLGFVQVALYIIFRPTKKSPAVGPSVSTDNKYILPVTVSKPKLDKVDQASPVATLIPPRCGNKLDNISSPALVPVCIS